MIIPETKVKDLNIDQFLCHHGVKGQKWGVRRYQNSDGSLTNKGKKRIQKNVKKSRKSDKKLIDEIISLDPYLGKELSKKYSPLLNKTFLGKVTISELEQISEKPKNLKGKGKKYLDQRGKITAKQKLVDIKNFSDNKIQDQINNKLQEMIQMNIQKQIDIRN